MRFLITAAPDPNKSTTEADPPFDENLMAAYMRYNEEMHRAGVLLASEGLNPAGRGARVGRSGRRRTVLDGPFAESKELVGGFYLIEVNSLEEAIAWAMRSPTGLGSDDILTIHPMTEAADIPPPMLKVAMEAAPTWTASRLKPQ